MPKRRRKQPQSLPLYVDGEPVIPEKIEMDDQVIIVKAVDVFMFVEDPNNPSIVYPYRKTKEGPWVRMDPIPRDKINEFLGLYLDVYKFKHGIDYDFTEEI